jgi:alkylation response protein AidB-like acyl-CoA dehydrogenase
MAQWCFLLARTTKWDPAVSKKQQGLTIFLVPMSDPAITVRPIRTMLGPHHLNEVFFDDLRVTDADVLGTVGEGWSIVADVLSFERVGIARYARCERLLQAAPSVLGDQWGELPAELRGRWARMQVHCRRARLMAYRLVSAQSAGRVAPGDAASYRIAVTKLDQDSAEVLMEILAEAPGSGDITEWFRGEVEDHWRYSQASTVSSGSIEMQRILLSRALMAAGA